MSRAPLWLSLAVTSSACAPEAGSDDPWSAWFGGDETVYEDAHANVIRAFSFLPEADGVLEGWDLDGVVDDEATAPCGLGDGVDADGTPGIDNQLGRMWSLVEGIIGEQVQELLQGSINEGRFLILIELQGLDDLENDDDVTVVLSRGTGDPWIGGAGFIGADQSFRVDSSVPVSTVERAVLVDGVLDAGPFDFVLPIDILEANFPMQVRDGRLRIEIDGQGAFSGLIGGNIDVDATITEILATDAAAEAATVEPIFRANTDVVDANGDCNLISSAFGYEATTAFVVHEVAE